MPSIEKIGLFWRWWTDLTILSVAVTLDNSMKHTFVAVTTDFETLHHTTLYISETLSSSGTSSSDKYHKCCINLTIAALANGKSDDLYSIMEFINSKSFLVAFIARGNKKYAFT